MHLIDIERVKQQVETARSKQFTWFYTQQTGSTNSDLLKFAEQDCIAITEGQTQGRGQRENQWHSEISENLLFSIAYNMDVSEQLALLPLVIGLAIKAALDSLAYKEVTLKWPNDIYYQGKKLGGILVESITQSSSVLMVVGVGLNVNQSVHNQLNNATLKTDGAELVDRSELLSLCIQFIDQWLMHIPNNLIEQFNQAHLYHLKPIQFKHNNLLIEGMCTGVSAQGELKIDDKAYSSGSIVVSNALY